MGKEQGPRPGTKTARVFELLKEGIPLSQIDRELKREFGPGGRARRFAQHIYTMGYLTEPPTQEKAENTAIAKSLAQGGTMVKIKNYADMPVSHIRLAVLLTTGEVLTRKQVKESARKVRKKQNSSPLHEQGLGKRVREGKKSQEQIWRQILPELPLFAEVVTELTDIFRIYRLPNPSNHIDQVSLAVYLIARKQWNEGKRTLMDEFSKALSRWGQETHDHLLPYMRAIYNRNR